MKKIKSKPKSVGGTDQSHELSEKDYSRSRVLFIAEGSFATAITTMSSGVIISGVLKFLGAPDSINGIISGLPVSAGILLLFMPLVFRRLTRVKLTVTIFAVVHRLLFALMLSVPLFIKDNSLRMYAFVIIYVLGYMIGSFIGPSAANWLVSLVPGRIRGRYMGLREGIMIATIAVMSIIVGGVTDHMKAVGNEALGYGICAAIIFVFTVLNFLCLTKIKEPPIKPSPKKITLKSIVSEPLKNKPFRKILMLTVIWSFSLQIGGPFYSIYLYSVLGLSYSYILSMNIINYGLRVLSAQVWGRLADRKNWEFVTKLSLIVLGIAHAGYLLMNAQTYAYVLPVVQIFAGIGWGGISISMFNLQFEYAPEENRTSYIAVNTATGSIVGFSAILLSSAVVKAVGGADINIASIPLNVMQILFLTAGALKWVTSLYIHKFIKPKRNGKIR